MDALTSAPKGPMPRASVWRDRGQYGISVWIKRAHKDVGEPCNLCAYFVFLEFFFDFLGEKEEKEMKKQTNKQIEKGLVLLLHR